MIASLRLYARVCGASIVPWHGFQCMEEQQGINVLWWPACSEGIECQR